MREANRTLFVNLERFCQRRSEPIPTAGRHRYVSVRDGEEGDQDKRDLTHGTLETRLRFGGDRSLAHVRVDTDDYIGLIGFDHEPEVSSLSLIDATPGLAILLLSEMSPRPRATPSEIRNVVEVGSMNDADYGGHNIASVGSLFPGLQLLSSDQPIDQDSAQRLFLMVSADECAQGASWIEDALADELVSLTDLHLPDLPYAAIGESMFDADPRSLYMALYRCIEATYAFETSRRLVEHLKLSVTWVEMAEALADVASGPSG